MTRNELLGQLKRGNFNMLKQFPGLSSDESLMLEAYILNPEIFNYISKDLIQKESFFHELASVNPELVKGTPYAGKKDFMKKLISSTPIAAKFMQKRLYDDPIFAMEIATKTEAGEIIIETMKKDPEIKSELQRLDSIIKQFEIKTQKVLNHLCSDPDAYEAMVNAICSAVKAH